MKRLTKVIISGVLLALLLLQQPALPAEAQCLSEFPAPFVVIDEPNRVFEFPNSAIDGVLPSDGGWYTEDKDLRWELTTQPHAVMLGCEDKLITYDTADEVHSCIIDICPGCNVVSNQVTVRRDATLPVVVTNLSPDQTVPVAEGATLAVDASQSFDETSGVATIAWSLDGDNLFDDSNPAIFKLVDGLSGNEPPFHSLVVQVFDQAGNLAEASLSVRIDNAPPSVHDVQTIVTEFGVDLTAGFTDPGVLDTHTATINWGDGTVVTALINEVEGSGTVLANHIYGQKGLFQITIIVTDKDGATGSAVTSVEAVNKPKKQFFLSVPASLAGTFEHPHADSAYRTLLNSVSTLEFGGAESFAEARFVIDPEGCFGLASWEAVNATQVLDPAMLCLTGVEMLDLVVPLELTGFEPGGARSWTNPAPVTAQSFIWGCGASEYQPYGNLSFQPGGLILTTSVTRLVGTRSASPETQVSRP